MVVDCGGGTIDVSSYSRESSGSFKETTAPECSSEITARSRFLANLVTPGLFQGAVFVTRRARDYFTREAIEKKNGLENTNRHM
jgi:hypothetical protein